ncbi:MAG: ABC transporter permease [Chloroflexota bacterium]|nr:ABC transporter permease [Chloroflexota bacterium]
MSRFLKRFIRAGAFISKEFNEVRRQPRLILALILGPFLILFLFGIGYQGETNNLNALVVVPPGEQYSRDVAEYREMTGNQLNVTAVSTDLNEALERLRRRDVDIVVVVPGDAARQISSGAQARLPVYFNEVDPLRRDWITYLSFLYTNEINKNTVAAVASQGQAGAGDLRSALARMRNSLAAVEDRVRNGQMQEASEETQRMQGNSTNVQLTVVLLAQLLASENAVVKPPESQDPEQVNLANGGEAAGQLSEDLRDLNEELNSPNPDRARLLERIGRVRADLDRMDALTQQFQSINPLVLAAPFYPQIENTAPIKPSFTSFYAPGVLVLILQHIAITLTALSMVRERLLGTVELFRVSPVSPLEILTGKFAGFLLLLGGIASVLLVMMSNNLVVGGVPLSLGVPILGDWLLLFFSIVLVIFASASLGLLIATVSKSESQAVQISMLVLLASVFFSGFFLRLEALWWPVRAVSYALPVTYGVSSLQVIMLRGGVPSPAAWVGDVPFPAVLLSLFTLGLLFALIGYLQFRRSFKQQ